MGVDPISLAVAAVTTLASTAFSVSQQQKQASAQKKAANQANKIAQQQADSAAKQAQAAQDEMNKSASKQASVGGYMNTAGQKGGLSSTMLTGPAGVDSSLLDLGKTTLLGQ